MKLDKYDVALVNAACKDNEIARPILHCLHFTDGRLEAVDGFMLAVRDLDIREGEEKPEALLNTRMVKQIKPVKNQEAILTITDGKATVIYQKVNGEPAEHELSINFKTFKDGKSFPDTNQLWPPTEKKAQICVSVELLKKMLATLPDSGQLRIGLTGEQSPIEFECSNMDRPIRGVLMPMLVDWKDFKWHRAKEA